MSPAHRRFLLLAAALPALACAPSNAADPAASGAKPALELPARPPQVEKLTRTADEWRRLLSPERFHVLREKGTERAFTGALLNNERQGVYRCAGCGLELFAAADKFDSGTGWPSFTRPAAPGRVDVEVDRSHGMVRDEVLCARCGGHLGHVFDDGPKPTGKRFCINSAALVFEAK